MKKYETKYYTVYNNAQAEPIEQKFNELLNEKAAEGWDLLTITNTLEKLSEPAEVDGAQYTHRAQMFTVWEKKATAKKK